MKGFHSFTQGGNSSGFTQIILLGGGGGIDWCTPVS